MQIRLAPGVWTNAAALALTGSGTVTAATATQTLPILIGWAGIAAGVALFLWGITVDGEHWWRTLPKPSNPFRRRGSLYVGRINVSDSELDKKHFFDVSITAFNGTAYSFQTAMFEGKVHVEFILNGSGKGGFDIRAPILYAESPKPHAPEKEFVLNSRLFLDPSQVAEYRRRMANGHSAQLMLSELRVELGTNRGKRVMLPLWDGVSLHLGGLMSNRILCITGHASISGNASLG